MHGRMIGGVNLERVVPSPVEPHDVVIRQVLHQLERFRVSGKEVLPGVRAALCLVVLVLPVDGLVRALLQQARRVLGEQGIPQPPPDYLDDVPARAAKRALQLLDDLAVAANRTVESLQVAVDDENQVVELLTTGKRKSAQGFRLITLAVAEKRPDLAVAHGAQAARIQIFHDVGLVDGLQRTQPHGNCRKLPIVGHEPRVGVGRQPLPCHLTAEVVQLALRQAAFEKGSGVDAGRGMTLIIDEIARLGFRRAAEEVVEPDVVKGGRRSKRGDMPAEIARPPIGTNHHGQRVPANERAYAPLHEQIARHERLFCLGNRVPVGGRNGVGQSGTRLRHARGQPLQQKVGPIYTFVFQHVLEGIKPLAGFLGFFIVQFSGICHRSFYLLRTLVDRRRHSSALQSWAAPRTPLSSPHRAGASTGPPGCSAPSAWLTKR